MDDLISRQAAIDVLNVGAELLKRVLDDADVVGAEREKYEWGLGLIESYISDMRELPSAQPERLTDDDFETIRIHLNAFKESLCNQGRWEEARDYERLIDRFMSFASAQLEVKCIAKVTLTDEQVKEAFEKAKDAILTAQPERKKGKWIRKHNIYGVVYCSECDYELHTNNTNFCPNCGAKMEVEHEA